MSVCMYVCMHVFIYLLHVCMYVCMYVCMRACMHACMYACMHVCVCKYHKIEWLLVIKWIKSTAKEKDVANHILFEGNTFENCSLCCGNWLWTRTNVWIIGRDDGELTNHPVWRRILAAIARQLGPLAKYIGTVWTCPWPLTAIYCMLHVDVNSRSKAFKANPRPDKRCNRIWDSWQGLW